MKHGKASGWLMLVFAALALLMELLVWIRPEFIRSFLGTEIIRLWPV